MGHLRSGCRHGKQKRIPCREKFRGPDFSRFSNASSIDFQGIFGTPSLRATLVLLVRLQRAKRIHGTGTAKLYWPAVASLRPQEDVLPNRRYHHLTSPCRKGMPYAGDDAANLLLIKKRRHSALHRCFGSRTLEEIILVLLWLDKVGRSLCGFLIDCYQRCCKLAKSQQRRRREAFLLQFYHRLSRFRCEYA